MKNSSIVFNGCIKIFESVSWKQCYKYQCYQRCDNLFIRSMIELAWVYPKLSVMD